MKPLLFDTTEDLQDFVNQVQRLLHDELCSRHYNTTGNLLHFYDAYCARTEATSLEEFYRTYEPQVFEDGLSCVGLGLHLSEELVRSFPGASPFLVSCEEMVQDVEAYCRADPPDHSSIKEHVLVGLSVLVSSGHRRGTIIMDPGYHVALPVVVMEDEAFPHTGRFVQSNTAKSLKEYCYTAVPETSGRFMCWNVTETRGGNVKTWDNILYVGGDFKSALSYSEMRNLVYEFRTLVARDGNGPKAGIYCKLNEVNRNPVFTFFYTDKGQRKETKVPFYFFSTTFQGTVQDDRWKSVVEACAAQVGMAVEELTSILRRMADLYDDDDFVNALLDINHRVDPFET